MRICSRDWGCCTVRSHHAGLLHQRVPLTDGAVFRGGVGFGGNYGRVCEMLYPRRAGTLRQKFQKIQRIFRTKSQSPKIFREIFLHKGKG
jgi:hypothetical protein